MWFLFVCFLNEKNWFCENSGSFSLFWTREWDGERRFDSLLCRRVTFSDSIFPLYSSASSISRLFFVSLCACLSGVCVGRWLMTILIELGFTLQIGKHYAIFTISPPENWCDKLSGRITNGLLILFQSHGVTTANLKKNNNLTLRRDQHINEKKRREKNDVADTTTVELLSLASRICSIKKSYSHSIVRCAIANTNGKFYTKNQFLSIFNCRVVYGNWPPLRSNHNHFSIYEFDKTEMKRNEMMMMMLVLFPTLANVCVIMYVSVWRISLPQL